MKKQMRNRSNEAALVKVNDELTLEIANLNKAMELKCNEALSDTLKINALVGDVQKWKDRCFELERDKEKAMRLLELALVAAAK